MRPETETERAERRAATVAAYRELVDPAAPPKMPHLLEHYFFAPDTGDMTGLIHKLEERGFHVETFAYDPDHPSRTWTLTVVRIELLEERRLLAVSDELDGLAREHDVTYDGWMTRVEE
ncbi:MAG: ribonuclease E inhibitor RraB [Bacillota bacterium]